MALYNTIPAPTKEEDALLETTSSKPKSLKRLVAGAAAVSFVLGALAATTITAKAVQTNNFPMMAQHPSPTVKKIVAGTPGIKPSSPSDWQYWSKWNRALDSAHFIPADGPRQIWDERQPAGPIMGIFDAMTVTFTEEQYVYHMYPKPTFKGEDSVDPKGWEGDPGTFYLALQSDLDANPTPQGYLDSMGVCRMWMGGETVMRCTVEPGFQAIVGKGVHVKYAEGDNGPGSPACDIPTMEDQVQVLSVLYDDGGDGGGYQAWDQYGDESKVFAPYVKECMMCPANKDDLRKSFDHPHKCHHDKHRKHGILMHDDDVPMPLMPDKE